MSADQRPPLLDRSKIRFWAFGAAAGLGLGLIVNALRNAWTRIWEIDFRVFYESGMAWRTGGDLYATARAFPNLNPPQFIVAFAPLTWFPPDVAVKVWLAINVAAAIGAAVIIWRELDLPRSNMAFMAAIAITGVSTCIEFGFEEGQPLGIFALLCTVAWSAQRRDDWKLAGCLLGVLVSLKPFMGCFLLVALFRRQWTTIVWSIVAALMSVAAGVAVAGVHSFSRWIEIGRRVSWFKHPLNASIAGLLARADIGWHLWLPLALFFVAATIVVIRKVDNVDTEWLACGVLSILVNPLGWVYYLPLLAGSLTAVALRAPSVLVPWLAFVWPVPLLMGQAAFTPWTAVTIYSLHSWGLIAVWCVLMRCIVQESRKGSIRGEHLRVREVRVAATGVR
jgi:glycosyl transferase family 87